MINILDERVNGIDQRVMSLEKLTKDIHSAVQKYKTKTYEKVMTEKFENLIIENDKF